MPIMPRADKKATKIAYRILGKPINMTGTKDKTSFIKKDDNREYDEFLRITPDKFKQK